MIPRVSTEMAPPLSGKTALLAHIGWPTHSFKASMIYNPWFARHGVDACVVPMGVKAEGFAASFAAIMGMGNVAGALITMPHKLSVLPLLDHLSTEVLVCGACNAVRKEADGSLSGAQFDGAGFARAAQKKLGTLAGARVLMVGCGGVGSAIAASLAAAGVAHLALFDPQAGERLTALVQRLHIHYPQLQVTSGSSDPAGFDLVLNATPLGMHAADPLPPLDVARIPRSALVADVVMKSEYTPFLRAAHERGCMVQVGTDMLFEMIPPYLAFFGLDPEGLATAEGLRAGARIVY